MNEIRIDVDGPDDVFVHTYIARLLKYAPDAKYYIQLEYGKETNKSHIQGWVVHNKLSNTFRDYMNKYLRENFNDKCATKAHAVLRSLIGQQSYIINNEIKPDNPKFWTNYSSEDLEEIISTVPVFKEKSKFLEEKTRRSSGSKWWNETFDILEARCIYTSVKNEKLINYRLIEDICYERGGKSLDKFILIRMMNGLTKKLEVTYPHNKNRRLRDSFHRQLSEFVEYQDVYCLAN